MTERSTSRGWERCRIGVDIGGTFTDCILVDDQRGALGLLKVPSQPGAPERAVLDGVRRLLEQSGVEPAAVRHFGHGTTLATNTVIEESGARVGLLATRGFRDVLLLARIRFPETTDLNGRLPKQLLERLDIREVTERMDADGRVVTPLAEDEVVTAVRDLVDSRGARAIVVSFLHSYRNDTHERKARAIIEREFPGLFVCGSAEVWPRPREYERSLVAVMNAYVGERMRRYLDGFREGVRELGIRAPVLVTRSNGGIMKAEAAGEYPVQTMLSGPAGGVVGAMHFAQQAGFRRIIAWDMGGTSLDVSVIDGRLRYTDKARIGDYPLFIPTVDVLSIGAGGGSIAWVDASGMLHVGPRSAGADPGPACYGRGGELPTLTDAYVHLGILNPGSFAGDLKLQPELAERALSGLGRKLGTDAVGAADAMLEVATAQMYAEFMPLTARYAVEPSQYALFPYGGAGPTHAFLFARAAGFPNVVVPLFPGLLCAWGSLIADVRFDVPRAIHAELDAIDEDRLDSELDAMGREAAAWLDAQGVPVTSTRYVRTASVRYKGQSFEVETPLEPTRVSRADIRASFLRAYQERYGYSDPDAPLEVVEVLVQGIGLTPKPDAAGALRPGGAPGRRASSSTRSVHIDGGWREVSVVWRSDLGPGDSRAGPLIVDQADTTTFVPPGYRVTVDPFGNLIGERTTP